MTQNPSLPPPGWYADPYQPGSQRWFDGTAWTTHAVATDTPHPDEVVESTGQERSPEELRRQEQFSDRSLTIPHDSEQPYDGGGGWQGVYANRVGRGVMRAGARWGPVHGTRWLGGLALVLALLAWGDHQHRVVLVVLAAIAAVATIIVGIRSARERAYWKDVGRNG